MYKAVITQYIAPEHGDEAKRYHAQKEIDIPFIPSKDMGVVHPDLGEYVLWTQSCHYDFGENKFFITIHARWIQVWDGREYQYDDTIKEMEAYVEHLRSLGWTVTERST